MGDKIKQMFFLISTRFNLWFIVAVATTLTIAILGLVFAMFL